MRREKKVFFSGVLTGAAALTVCFIAAVLCCAGNSGILTGALLQLCRGVFQMSDEALCAFSRQTISYLTGKSAFWQPSVPFEIPSAFRTHMQEIRSVYRAATVLNAFFFFITVFFVFSRMKRHTFSVRSFFAGSLTALLAFSAPAVWSLSDFRGFWSALHRLLIPGGIFAAGEPVMKLFPSALFQCYIFPVLTLFVLFYCILCVLPLCLYRRRDRPKRSFYGPESKAAADAKGKCANPQHGKQL